MAAWERVRPAARRAVCCRRRRRRSPPPTAARLCECARTATATTLVWKFFCGGWSNCPSMSFLSFSFLLFFKGRLYDFGSFCSSPPFLITCPKTSPPHSKPQRRQQLHTHHTHRQGRRAGALCDPPSPVVSACVCGCLIIVSTRNRHDRQDVHHCPSPRRLLRAFPFSSSKKLLLLLIKSCF